MRVMRVHFLFLSYLSFVCVYFKSRLLFHSWCTKLDHFRSFLMHISGTRLADIFSFLSHFHDENFVEFFLRVTIHDPTLLPDNTIVKVVKKQPPKNCDQCSIFLLFSSQFPRIARPPLENHVYFAPIQFFKLFVLFFQIIFSNYFRFSIICSTFFVFWWITSWPPGPPWRKWSLLFRP